MGSPKPSSEKPNKSYNDKKIDTNYFYKILKVSREIFDSVYNIDLRTFERRNYI